MKDIILFCAHHCFSICNKLQDQPQEQTAFPPRRLPIPKPRTKKPETFKEQPANPSNQYFEEPEYEDTVNIKPSNRPLRKSAPLPFKELEKHSGTNEQVDIVGDHVYDLPDQWMKVPPRDVPRKRPIAPPQVGPKPPRGHLHGDSPQNTFNGGSDLKQPGLRSSEPHIRPKAGWGGRYTLLFLVQVRMTPQTRADIKASNSCTPMCNDS